MNGVFSTQNSPFEKWKLCGFFISKSVNFILNIEQTNHKYSPHINYQARLCQKNHCNKLTSILMLLNYTICFTA